MIKIIPIFIWLLKISSLKKKELSKQKMRKIFKTISFKVSPYEAELLEKLARIKGTKNVSEYIRSKIFDYQNKTEEEFLRERQEQSEKIISELKKYLTPLLKTTMVTHAFIDQTLGTQITQEKQQDIINDMKEKIDKIENKSNK